MIAAKQVRSAVLTVTQTSWAIPAESHIQVAA
jgi:hypothetical protein